MPVYESLCLKCGARHEYIRHFSKSQETPICCEKRTEKRIFSAPSAQLDIQPWESYLSPATGKLITSRAERREDMRASGCRDWEGLNTEKKIAARYKKEEEDRQEQLLDEAAQSAWAQLPPNEKDIILNN